MVMVVFGPAETVTRTVEVAEGGLPLAGALEGLNGGVVRASEVLLVAIGAPVPLGVTAVILVVFMTMCVSGLLEEIH